MPIKLLPGGCVLSTRSDHKRKPGVRGKTMGWSAGVSARNNQFLMSVDRERLTGYGYACTFTLRECPPTAADWAGLLDRLWKRFRRLSCGFIRYHAVVEWQPRTHTKDPELRGKAVPHLHALVYFEREANDEASTLLAKVWIKICTRAGYTVNFKSQRVRLVDSDPVGWFKYTIKHILRTEDHYQRNIANAPTVWREQGSLGRMWFRGGDWPIGEGINYEFVYPADYFVYRRRVIAWQLSVLDVRDFRKRWINYTLRMHQVFLKQENNEQKYRQLMSDMQAFKYLRRQLKSIGHSQRGQCLSGDELERVSRSFGSSVWCPGGVLLRGLPLIDLSDDSYDLCEYLGGSIEPLWPEASSVFYGDYRARVEQLQMGKRLRVERLKAD